MRTLDLQLFVLLHAPSIRYGYPHRNARYIDATIGSRIVTSTVRTLRRRRWLRFARPFHADDYSVGVLCATELGERVLWDSACEAMGT